MTRVPEGPVGQDGAGQLLCSGQCLPPPTSQPQVSQPDRRSPKAEPGHLHFNRQD